jgi:hypothetical protein
MRAIVLVFLVFVSCGGCAAPPLKHYTLNQALSVSDMRYQQVLKDLAAVANNSGTLPSFALTAGGAANVTNTLSLETTTLWDQAVKGFSMETLTAFAQHSPDLQWTLSPVASAPLLEGLGYACLWALNGPPPEGSRPMELLREPRFTDVSACVPAGAGRPKPTYHLGVASQLAALPPGWLRVAPKHLAPKNARYQATCGNTTVWVPDENIAWLSEFTLILLDIATIDPPSLVLPSPKASVDISFTSKPAKPGPTAARADQGKRAVARTSSRSDGANAAARGGQSPEAMPPVPQIDPIEDASLEPKWPYMGYLIGPLKQGEKITEIWDACQDPCNLSIKLSRPKTHRYPRSAMPDVQEADLEAPGSLIKPLLNLPFTATSR